VLWPGQEAVGQPVIMNGKDSRVIGVIADVHQNNVEGEPGWQIYFPVTQESPNGAHLVIHSKIAPTTLAGSVLGALRELNPNQPAAAFQPIQGIVDRAVSPRRFFMLLVAFFAALGLTLAALGVYGVISYSVTRRTQEIGIRMALGATQGRVQLDVLQRTFLMAAVGIAVGTIASLLVARGLASLLYGTQPTDTVTFAGMILVLGIVALLAGYVPARRASRIHPMIALRTN
jgi:ABC-type antimicrobial peptide transport system permease subunit